MTNEKIKEAIEYYQETIKCDFDDETTYMAKLAIEALEQQPKTGHWKRYTYNIYHRTDEDGEPIWKPVNVYYCSNCNRRTVIKDNFCPNCGTYMRKDSDTD